MFVSDRELEAHRQATKGKLVDIGAHGARFLVSNAVSVGSHVVLEVELPSARREFNRIRFEGMVTRSEPQHEVAVAFLEPGEFLRPELAKLDEAGARESGEDEG